jgi:hypothetical protein
MLVQALMTLTEFIDNWTPPWVIGTIIMIVPAAVTLVIYRWFIRLAGHYSPFFKSCWRAGRVPRALFW